MNMRGLSLRDLMSAADEDAAPTTAQAPAAARPSAKASIGFILGHQSDDDHYDYENNARDEDAAARTTNQQQDVRMRGDDDDDETLSEREDNDRAFDHRRARTGVSAGASAPHAHGADTSARKTKKRKARICKEPGCQKYVVDHGLCIRHGGGKRCSVEDCNCRAQNRGLCWKHGGYTICKIDGCTKRAKSRGICWSHGGGTRCKDEGCTKIAVSHGKCWAHGGGKRCIVDGCKRPASERTDNCCADHYGGRPSDHADAM